MQLNTYTLQVLGYIKYCTTLFAVDCNVKLASRIYELAVWLHDEVTFGNSDFEGFIKISDDMWNNIESSKEIEDCLSGEIIRFVVQFHDSTEESLLEKWKCTIPPPSYY